MGISCITLVFRASESLFLPRVSLKQAVNINILNFYVYNNVNSIPFYLKILYSIRE